MTEARSGSFEDQVKAIYGRHPQHIWPFMGRAFLQPGPHDLRVMTVGINAYVSPPDWREEGIDPARFQRGFRALRVTPRGRRNIFLRSGSKNRLGGVMSCITT
jgi:hypothetical protein